MKSPSELQAVSVAFLYVIFLFPHDQLFVLKDINLDTYCDGKESTLIRFFLWYIVPHAQLLFLSFLILPLEISHRSFALRSSAWSSS